MPATSSAGASAPGPGAVMPARSGAALASAGAPAIWAGAAATLAAVNSPAPATCTPATLTLFAAGFSVPGETTSAGGVPGCSGVPGDVIDAGDGAVVEVVGPPGAPG